MSSSEERLRILQMLEAQRLTVEEAARLLEALREAPKEPPGEGRPFKGSAEAAGRWFRLRVTDLATGRTKVSINMPVGIVSALARLGGRFVPHSDEFDVGQVLDAIRNGEVGQIIDVMDHEDGEHVEVFIE